MTKTYPKSAKRALKDYTVLIDPLLTLSFGIVSVYGNLTVHNKSQLIKIVTEACKIFGKQQLCLTNIYERQFLNKAHPIVL